jgi:hypothetical protein
MCSLEAKQPLHWFCSILLKDVLPGLFEDTQNWDFFHQASSSFSLTLARTVFCLLSPSPLYLERHLIWKWTSTEWSLHSQTHDSSKMLFYSEKIIQIKLSYINPLIVEETILIPEPGLVLIPEPYIDWWISSQSELGYFMNKAQITGLGWVWVCLWV